jgi:hypothetical protein
MELQEQVECLSIELQYQKDALFWAKWNASQTREEEQEQSPPVLDQEEEIVEDLPQQQQQYETG